MNYEQRFVADVPPLELRTDENGTKNFQGAFAVFNSRSHDLGGFKEELDRRAFNRVLARGDNIQAWFNHNPDNLLATVRSGTLRLWTDDRGAWYEFPFDESDPDHQRVASKAERGDLVGSSFGFRAATDEWTTDENDLPLRRVTEVAELRDVGPVSMPAYPATESVGAMTFRSLADLTDLPVEELVAASKAGTLRDTLLSVRADTAQKDSDADSPKDADSDAVKRATSPLAPKTRDEWRGYIEGGS